MSGKYAGSGISYGHFKGQYHVEKAVSQAIDSAQLSQVTGVFLFLTDDHTRDLTKSLRTVVRISSTMQVFGCTAMGVFTDQDWVVDGSAAAALVVGDGVSVSFSSNASDKKPLISLLTPKVLTSEWLDTPLRFGAIASDSSGDGPFAVWSHARPDDSEQVECVIEGVDSEILVAQGVKALTSPMEVGETSGFNLLKLGGYPALSVLINALPSTIRKMERIPLHMLMCGITFGDPESAISEGRYRLDHILSANPEDYSITLTDKLERGERLFWALRDRISAEREMQRILAGAEKDHPPDFALMFSCLGRGPGFYAGVDRDVEILRQRFPDLPFAGFYGNGEIAPLNNASHLFSYSAGIGLFRRN